MAAGPVWDDPRVARGLARQHEWRRERLAQGERSLGWKVAFSAPPMKNALPQAPVGGLSEGELDHAGGGVTGGESAPRLRLPADQRQPDRAVQGRDRDAREHPDLLLAEPERRAGLDRRAELQAAQVAVRLAAVEEPRWSRLLMQEPDMAKSTKSKPKSARKRATASKTKAPGARADSKQAKLIEMLKQPDGASIDEIVKKFEWQPHTVRGAIAGALKKKLGLDVQSEKVDGRGRVYRIAG